MTILPAESPMTVSGLSSTLSSTAVITVQIWFTHTYNGDCTIRLYAPDESNVTLSEKRGEGNDNIFNGTLFTDEAVNSVVDYPFSNNVVATPLKPETPFTNLRGKNPNGQWKIWIQDYSSSDSGYLNRVVLNIKGFFKKKKTKKKQKKNKST